MATNSSNVATDPTHSGTAFETTAELEGLDVANFQSGTRAHVEIDVNGDPATYELDRASVQPRAVPFFLWTKNSYGNDAIPGRWVLCPCGPTAGQG